jgi:transposase InsO family protein
MFVVAQVGLHGLGALGVWWIRLGIRPLRTEPASPEQNGAHERFHRTLKAETGAPVAGNRIVQQRRFNRFRTLYNDQRPTKRSPSARRLPSGNPLALFPNACPSPNTPCTT